MIVYLAGGMKGDWQDKIINALPFLTYIDPRTHGLIDEHQYTEWDLNGVKTSDIVFACMTADNPSGYGMCVELGYARALGKVIIFVDERSPVDDRFSRYMGMCRSIANFHVLDIDTGISKLQQLMD